MDFSKPIRKLKLLQEKRGRRGLGLTKSKSVTLNYYHKDFAWTTRNNHGVNSTDYFIQYHNMYKELTATQGANAQ